MNCRHLVLTGASGFLGKHILHSYLTSREGGAEVQYKIHALYKSQLDFDQHVQAFAGELKDKAPCTVLSYALDLTNSLEVGAWLKKQMQDVDVIDACIHVAAIANPGPCEKDPERAESVNVPKAFFDAIIQKKNCHNIIALSTDHVYNQPCQDETKDENLNPVNVYGRTKLAMEQYLLSEKGPRQAICLRSSIILGPKAPISPESSHSTFLHFCASREGQETTFWTDEMRNVVFVGDVIASIRWFVDHESGEKAVYNMGGPDSLSRFDMAQAVFGHFSYDTTCLIAQEKAKKPPNLGAAPSPLDISMDSSRLHKKIGRSFATLGKIIQETFPQ